MQYHYSHQVPEHAGTTSLTKVPVGRSRHTVLHQLLPITGLTVLLLLLFSQLLLAQTPQELYAWGRYSRGQLGNGFSGNQLEPMQTTEDTDWKQVSAGGNFTLAVKSDGTLWAWGFNQAGQLGDGTTNQSQKPLQIGTESNWRQVSAGGNHCLAIKNDGTLWAWGYNYYGAVGNGTNINQTTPVQIGTEINWASVVAGSNHSLAIKSDGTLWAWGLNSNGQLGDGTTTGQRTPVQIGSATDWTSASAGAAHSLAIKSDGTLWAWGANYYGQLGDGTTTQRLAPSQIGTADDWTSASAGAAHSLAIKSDGTLWAWGANYYGQLGDGTTTQQLVPRKVGSATNWLSISAGSNHSLAIKSDGTLWAWGLNSNGQLGDGATTQRLAPSQIGTADDWTSASAGEAHNLAIKSDGTLWAWGWNEYGQLGIVDYTQYQVGTATNWTTIAAGYSHSLGVKNDGSLWAWGENSSGQLGDGTTTQQSVPVQISTETNWASVAAGSNHSLAIKSDGTLWAWGYNSNGQLGIGATTYQNNLPLQIGNTADWTAVTAGENFSLGVKIDGSLWAWGYNGNGQLGDGTYLEQYVPVQIGTATDWATVSAGYHHSLGIKDDGTLWTWGLTSNVPVQIGTDSDWKFAASGYQYSLAVKSDGSLWSWGNNEYGQLGDGTTTQQLAPKQIGTATDWTSIAAGYAHSLGIKNDGSLWAWGYNVFGQLGDGTITQQSVPVQISTETNWASVAAGSFHSLALTGALSNNTDLAALSLSAGTLSPAFAAATGSYTATVANSNSSITVTPSVADAAATVTVNGVAVASGTASAPVSLSVGENTITVVVTAADGTTTKTYTIVVSRENGAPVLAAIGNKTGNEGAFLTFTASATDADADQSLSYSLENAPVGAQIDPVTGFFSWSPSEAQGPNTYTFTVKVTDNGSPALSDEEQITITVNEVNVAPVVAAIANATINCGESVSFTASATDTDLPANGFTYSLQGIVPAGASLNPSTGAFSWTPAASQVGSHQFTLRITDTGTPALYHEQSFTLTLEDTQAPVALTQNITVQLDATGTATITAAQLNNGSSDNCTATGDLVLSLDKTSFSCANTGRVYSPGTALDFGASNDYAQISNPYYTFTKELTVSWWVNFQGGSAWLTQSTWGADNMAENVWLMHPNGAYGLTWYVNDNGSWRSASMTTTPGWHMVTGTANAQGTYLYVDGVLVSSSAGISGQIRNNANSVIGIGVDGRLYYEAGRYENFQADEIAVYNRALSANEIKGLYISSADLTDNTLVGYWPLNEGTGLAIADQTATGAHGTLFNMTNADWVSSSAGANTVTLTVTDAAGNSSTATATVTVEDKVAPIALAQNLIVQLDAAGTATITAEQINNGSSDNCTAAADLQLSLDKSSFSCANLGNNTVTLTVTDAAGNSSTATATITVEDKLAPSLEVQNVTLQLDVAGNATLTEAAAVTAKADNCGTATISFSKGSFSCSDVGAPSTVTVTATDAAGNATTADITVTVEDKIAPTVTAQNIIVQLDATGTATITAAQINGGSSDNCTADANLQLSLDKTSFTCANVGANQVTLTAADASGNRATAMATVTVEDKEAPTAIAQNLTVQLDAAGTASITAAQVNNGSTDNCTAAADLQLSLDKSSFSCADLGTNTVVLMVTDAAGNSSTATATVTVEDSIVPTAIAQNLTVQLDAAGTASITAAQINNGSTDNCSIASLSLDKSSFSCANLGDNTVTLTVTDAAGNSATATATVTVEDKVAPVAVAQNITVQLDASGNAIITAAQINNGSSDNCTAAADLVLSLDKTSFSCAVLGANAVTLSVTDAAGNSSTATATVTVEDTVKPTAVVQNITVQLDAAGNATITPAQLNGGSSDNCTAASELVLSLDKTSFSCAELGANTVTLTVTDAAGNSSTATATVTVEDRLAPSLSVQNVTLQLDATGAATLTEAAAVTAKADNCGTSTIRFSKTSFGCADAGTPATVTVTATDAAGNATTADIIVTIEDKVQPTVLTQNITVQLDATGTATITAAQINGGSTDNCTPAADLILSVDKASFTCANLGANTVTLSVTDAAGNSSTATATVTVEDNLAPTALVQNLTIQLDATGNASITAAQLDNGSMDNCSIASMSLDKTGFTCANIGVNSVTLTVTDAAGNSATATATVTVEDATAPTVLVQNITVQLDAAGTATITAAQINTNSSDNCTPAADLQLSLDKTSFNCSEIGANTVTLTVTDASGNSSTATATVTVEDKLAPTALAQNLTVQLDAAGAATITADQINNGSSDNCSLASLSLDKTSFSCAELGANTVTLTVTDAAGNSSTATATVTIEDKLAPTAVAQNLTVQLDESGNATITAAQLDGGSSDNCTAATALQLSLDKSSFSCANIGANTVTLTVTDASGNSSTATATVTVTEVIAPVITTCPADRSVEIRANQPYTMQDFTSELTATDNCAGASVTQSPAAGTVIDQAGVQQLQFVVRDASGNETTCSFTLTVLYINSAPTDIALSNNSLEEHQPADSFIGTFSTQDPDAGDAHTYQLVAGTGSEDNAYFYLQGDELFTTTYFDYEVKKSYSIRVASTDREGASVEKVFTINVLDIEDVRVYVPNLFSPNGDGQNDTFKVRAGGIQQLSFRIFNRWGELVWETSNVNEATEVGWSGSFKGKDLPSGTYVWQLMGTYTDGTPITVAGKNTGNITLIR